MLADASVRHPRALTRGSISSAKRMDCRVTSLRDGPAMTEGYSLLTSTLEKISRFSASVNLFDVAADRGRELAPLLDVLFIGVDDRARILQAEALADFDIAGLLHLLVFGGHRPKSASGLIICTPLSLMTACRPSSFATMKLPIAILALSQPPRRVHLLLLGRELVPGVAVHEEADRRAAETERHVDDVFGEVGIAEGAQPVGDAVLAIETAALQQADRFDQRRADRHCACHLEHVGIAAGCAHTLALQVRERLDRRRAGQEIGRRGPAAERAPRSAS